MTVKTVTSETGTVRVSLWVMFLVMIMVRLGLGFVLSFDGASFVNPGYFNTEPSSANLSVGIRKTS